MNEDHAPDFRRGFLRVPLSIWIDLYCRAPLTRRQLQIVSVVIRESWGWQKPGGEVYRWTRPLTPRQFAALTGLSTDHLARDLKVLVAQGVLRERAGQYQLLPDLGLWKTSTPAPPEGRPAAPKSPGWSAETALPLPGLKTDHKQQRNVVRPVDNFASALLAPPGKPSLSQRALLEARFCRVVAAFVGGMSQDEAEGLRARVQHEGIAAVWASLGPAFRSGPAAVRAVLQQPVEEARGAGA
jgi:hypothetical protein